MQMFLDGQWVDGSATLQVTNPYDASVVDTVPAATAAEVDRAIAGLVRGAETMRRMPAARRYEILHRAAQLMNDRLDELGATISREEGKTLGEGVFEASRAMETIVLSAEEAKRIYGEVLPLDAAPGGEGKFGFTLRVPCGVVAAVTPFNFPLNLVCHKIGPAIAAGNAVLLKPASDTPLSALEMVAIMLEAGLPAEAIACVTGSGAKIGDQISQDPCIRKISFTGSRDVGEHICHKAGIKRVTMELGSNAPLIVMDDADLERVVTATVATGYANAGQVCISAQRVIAAEGVYDEFLDLLAPKVAALTTGDPFDKATQMGPMIRAGDADRVSSWIAEAVSGGARLLTGGEHEGTRFQPTLLAEVTSDMKVSRDEIFGPAVGVARAANVDEAIRMANDTPYGLSAAIFTQDLDRALTFAHEVESGNIHINWGPQWRADLMPYGGLKDSGLGKEGPKYAIEEMTETKMVVVHRNV